jgi:hypothetical protein
LGVNVIVCLKGKGKEKMRIAILAAMLVVAVSSNPFIHRDSARDKNCTPQPISPLNASETTSEIKPANTQQQFRLRGALRDTAIVRPEQACGY